ncbi:MAG: glycosyltransferase family 2 protein [Phycisphaerales bacterium]|nr:glycosyltransferase family 2 protein [Phycisphaerales bacterium]
MQKPSITLIVSTYNQPDFLRLVLQGIANQQDPNFQLILADDGSEPETKSCIDLFSTEHDLKFEHIWHEDNGFQKSEILNKAISASTSDYLVFLDGDCIPRQSFIKDHRNLARQKRIVGCSRILLDQTITQHLLDNDLQVHAWSLISLLKIRISGHLNRFLPLMPAFLGPFRAITPKAWKRVRGFNFGIYREDMLAIGGFDESFTGWGYEDSELAVRAINSNCLVRRGDHRATVLHLWHPDASRSEATSNKSHLEDSIQTGRKTAISTSI